MIGKLSMVRHGIVGAAIAGTTLLAGLGVIADPHAGKEERFDAKTLVIAPEGERGVRITEYVDIDFGSAERRGYRRIIPNDLGVPTDVVAATPDAAADLAVIPHVSETEIRIGDPDRTWRGQHRYQLSYTLPDAYEPTATPPDLFLDIVAPVGIGEGDAETGRFEVIVTGFELSDTRCDVGRGGDEGGCELVAADDDTHRVVLEPLAAGRRADDRWCHRRHHRADTDRSAPDPRSPQRAEPWARRARIRRPGVRRRRSRLSPGAVEGP
jgi:hypothetical protein